MIPLIRHHIRSLAHSPSTGIFLAFGWVLTTLLTLSYGDFLSANHAGLELMYGYVPWVMCLLIPALTMQVAEEPARGVAERLHTLPYTPAQRVLARFFVHWALLGLWLLGLWPMAATVFYLGQPDAAPLLSGLIGCWLLAAPLLAFSLWVARYASGSVPAFLLGFGVCLILTLIGAPVTISWLVGAVPPSFATPMVMALQTASPFAAFLPFVAGFVSLSSLILFGTLAALGIALQLSAAFRSAALVATVALFALASTPAIGRLGVDVTADNLHTLSPATTKLIKGLHQPVTFTLVQSTGNPDIPPAVLQNAEAARKLLLTLKHYNPSKIKLLYLNPDASPAHALQALRSGVEEQVLPSGTSYFSGLSAQVGNHLSLIRALEPQRQPFLEFDVISLLTQAQRTSKPNLALLTQINTLNPTATPRWMGEIGSSYNLTQLPLAATAIPAGTNLLLLVGNPVLPETTLAAIRTYLENGGNTVWLADPLWRTAPADLQETTGTRSLAEFFDSYGVLAQQDVVVGDASQATPVAQQGTGYTAYPFWLSLTAGNLNPQLPFATFVDNLLLAEPGIITVHDLKPGLTVTPIISTSKHAQLIERSTFNATPAELLAGNLKTPQARYTLAALVTGPFGNASSPPATLLVVNDIDWLNKRFALEANGAGGPGSPLEYTPINSNLVLFYNALQYTLGETALVELRGKATTRRTLTRVEALLSELTRRTTMLEQKLAAQLYQVSQNLEALQAQTGADTSSESLAAQQQQIDDYQQQQFELRQQLRQLRSHTRQQLQGLKTSILLLNLLTMPLLLAIGLYLWRRRTARAQ
ncbi:MAG: hypothetical protein GC129_06185 [Proteobacteria bacterium]|nr:hypothetical protein [Pseudomonadota bacterium]